MSKIVRMLESSDYEQWLTLFIGYRDFYEQKHDEKIIATTWEWLLNDDENIHGLVCIENSSMVGFMHYYESISSLGATKSCFLNDLYVAPTSRGKQVFEALFDQLKMVCEQNSWPYVQWRTAENNYRARSAYDKIAEKTPFSTYRLTR